MASKKTIAKKTTIVKNPTIVKKTERDRRRAVVDIGSNSVRLVIYDGPRRAPIPVCNEKALCGLGREIGDDGSLNPDAVADALATLARFAGLLKAHGGPVTHTIATAAVREARDGAKFVAKVKKLGFDVSVLTGAEEATLAALGIVSFEPGAAGLAGDMGGGSLELIQLKDGSVGDSESLSIGPLTIMKLTGGEIAQAHAPIDKALDSVKWLKPGKFDTLYTVGGAWRALARIHMRLRSYPLSVLHHYELSAKQAVEICDLVAQQSRRSLEEIPGIARRRLDTLPYAALVLKSVMQRTGAKRMVVSAAGVREGILYRELDKAERKIDPLIAASRFYAARMAPDPSYGDAVTAVTAPLFADASDREMRLIKAVCQLVDIAAFFHPDHRGRHAFNMVLHAPVAGLSHEDRVFMALALYRRHQGRTAALPNEQALGLLSWDGQQRATRLGLAIRFAALYSLQVAAPLENCRLELKDGELIFRARAAQQILMGETSRKRLASLAAAFDATPVEIFED